MEWQHKNPPPVVSPRSLRGTTLGSKRRQRLAHPVAHSFVKENTPVPLHAPGPRAVTSSKLGSAMPMVFWIVFEGPLGGEGGTGGEGGGLADTHEDEADNDEDEDEDNDEDDDEDDDEDGDEDDDEDEDEDGDEDGDEENEGRIDDDGEGGAPGMGMTTVRQMGCSPAATASAGLIHRRKGPIRFRAGTYQYFFS